LRERHLASPIFANVQPGVTLVKTLSENLIISSIVIVIVIVIAITPSPCAAKRDSAAISAATLFEE
jgi:hypothetical protein